MKAALKNHELVETERFEAIGYEHRPVLDAAANEAPGLHEVRITLNNEKQLNSYTTRALKELILAFRRASCDRRAVAVVFTGTGTKAFCTGGNTEEYATYYAGRPLEYLQYMRLFNDCVTAILLCDKPVICRVNGMRIAGGQELGMACDFTIAGDHARFGQAGPKHGSAPDGGSTDFLDLFIGVGRAPESLVLCEPWSAHRAMQLGIVNELAPVHRGKDGAFVANPFVVVDRQFDEFGRPVYGAFKEGAELQAAKAAAAQCTIDLTGLDASVGKMVSKLLDTFPDCTRKTLESFRKKKLEHWQRNCESNRSWLSLNMNTEAMAGFCAFHFGEKGQREIDFAELRRRLADGARFDRSLVEAVLPASALAGFRALLETNE